MPIFKFCEEKVFRSYKHFFETLKPNSQETAQNFEKLVLQKCLRIAFYTYIPVNLYSFLKNHHNRCTLLTNSALIDEPKCGGGRGCWVSATEYIGAHGAQINFGYLTPYLIYEFIHYSYNYDERPKRGHA